MTSALVLGGGLSGMLAAAALAACIDEVTVVERDELPDAPRPRRGLPQSPHNHILLGGGAEAIEALLPGTVEELHAAGAHRRAYLENILIRVTESWSRRQEIDAYAIACSRDLVDHVIRQRVFDQFPVKLIENAEVVGLTGDAKRVTGARVERRQGPAEIITADIVVDATGGRSKAPQWLTDLGLPMVREEYVDPGFAYSRRVYEAPAGFRDDFPGILIGPLHGTGHPGVGAALLPNENGRWMVVMIGTRGANPPSDDQGFLEFAGGERTRVVYDLISSASPVTPVRSYHDLANRRRCYHRLPVPQGFLVVGDAATRVNPTYATGMSTAALTALELRRQVMKSGGVDGRFTRRAQAAIAKIAERAWQQAVSIDHWFPDVETNVRRRGGKGMMRFARRYARVGAEKPNVAQQTFQVVAMMAPPSRLMRPPLIASVLRGPRQAPLSADQAIAQYPQLVKALGAAEAPSQ